VFGLVVGFVSLVIFAWIVVVLVEEWSMSYSVFHAFIYLFSVFVSVVLKVSMG